MDRRARRSRRRAARGAASRRTIDSQRISSSTAGATASASSRTARAARGGGAGRACEPEHVGRGLVPGDQQQVRDADELVGGEVAGVLAQEHADEVVARVPPGPGHEGLHVGQGLGGQRHPPLLRKPRVELGVRARLELVLVARRDAEQLADHERRDGQRVLRDEVGGRAGPLEGVEVVVDDLDDPRLQPAHAAHGGLAHEHLAQPRVLRRVEGEQVAGAVAGELTGVATDPVGRAREVVGCPAVGERVGVAEHPADVGLPGQQPRRRAERRRHPGDPGAVPQLLGVRGGAEAGAPEVEGGGGAGGGGHTGSWSGVGWTGVAVTGASQTPTSTSTRPVAVSAQVARVVGAPSARARSRSAGTCTSRWRPRSPRSRSTAGGRLGRQACSPSRMRSSAGDDERLVDEDLAQRRVGHHLRAEAGVPGRRPQRGRGGRRRVDEAGEPVAQVVAARGPLRPCLARSVRSPPCGARRSRGRGRPWCRSGSRRRRCCPARRPRRPAGWTPRGRRARRRGARRRRGCSSGCAALRSVRALAGTATE